MKISSKAIFLFFSVTLAVSTTLISSTYMKAGTSDSIIYGFCVLIVSLLIEIIFQIEKSTEILKKNISKYTQIEESTYLTKYMDKLIETYEKDIEDKFPFMSIRNIYHDRVNSHILTLEKFKVGQFNLGSSDWLSTDTKFLGDAKNYMYATSHADFQSVWKSKLGDRYWNLTKTKINQGFICKRVFILTEIQYEDNLLKQQIIDTMQEQNKNGVEVYVTKESLINRKLCKDYAIFDGKLLSTSLVTPSGFTSGTNINWNNVPVKEALIDFNLLIENSFTLDEFMS